MTVNKVTRDFLGSKIYGASDDLLEFCGDIYGEVCYYDSSPTDPIYVKMSDGTEFQSYYSKEGLWKIVVSKEGSLFDRVEVATDPDSDKYSDILYLKAGKVTAVAKAGDSDWLEVL